ncbi:MAG: hypothetical protein ACOCQI_00040 [Desulfosalsimonas sp.]
MSNKNAHSRRPIWIWVISIFYFGIGISGLMVIAMALAVKSQGPGPAGQAPSLDDMMRSSLWGLLPAANIAAAASLFFLRKTAFHIFSALFAAKLVLQLVFETPFLGAVSKGNAEMIIGYGLGYIILLVVCIYTWRLKQSGVLK